MSSESFTLALESLSADGSAAQPGRRSTRENVDEATVRACLAAFAAIPAVDLVGVDARMRLRWMQRQVAVYRSGADLFFTPLPEASHTPVRCTPDGVLAYLAGREVAPAPESITAEPSAPGSSAPEPGVPEPERQRVGFRRGWSLPIGAKIAILAVTASIGAGLVYQEVSRPAPLGYEWIDDSKQLDEIRGRLDGHYGNPAATESLSFTISGGTLSMYYTGEAGGPRELVRSSSFRLAKRAGYVVALITGNGEVLELQPDGRLLHGERYYDRTPRP